MRVVNQNFFYEKKNSDAFPLYIDCKILYVEFENHIRI
jgi:hypothetical protein